MITRGRKNLLGSLGSAGAVGFLVHRVFSLVVHMYPLRRRCHSRICTALRLYVYIASHGFEYSVATPDCFQSLGYEVPKWIKPPKVAFGLAYKQISVFSGHISRVFHSCFLDPLRPELQTYGPYTHRYQCQGYSDDQINPPQVTNDKRVFPSSIILECEEVTA